MIYEIIGTYRGQTEVVDTFDTLGEARYALREYRLAFGPDWVLSIHHHMDSA